jgi:hypothetical protein
MREELRLYLAPLGWGILSANPIGGTTVPGLVNDFLAQKRIAVAGVSRSPATHGANAVYRRLRERGYQVFAVNPNATQVEGDACYSDLRAIPATTAGRTASP